MSLGMGGHHKPNQGDKDEWLTPKFITDALGPFALDPCAPLVRPWDTAETHFTIEDDGLSKDWSETAYGGLVWCNPPYGAQTWQWLDKLADHYPGGIALIFARTETAGFFKSVWGKATSIVFLEGRLFFHHVNGERASANAGAPSCLVAYGGYADVRLITALNDGKIKGSYVRGWKP